jgi:hypothetical protein
VATLLVIGTFHEIQERDFADSGEFKRVLTYLAKQFDVGVILEEWTENKGATVGSHVAKALDLDWMNVGTPPTEEFKTKGAIYDPMEEPPMLVNRYGPIEVQRRRENLIVEAIEQAMTTKNVALMICGMAHLHSLCEKLSDAGFEVEAFHWSQPAAGTI